MILPTEECGIFEDVSVVIMAGGRGSRLNLDYDLPKSMVSVAGKPILEWQLESLISQGVKRVHIVVSSASSAIQRYFGKQWTLSAQRLDIVSCCQRTAKGFSAEGRSKIARPKNEDRVIE
jgi:NDP-sugar pyrophosphorylase family protein